jgi:hypothetical protein
MARHPDQPLRSEGGQIVRYVKQFGNVGGAALRPNVTVKKVRDRDGPKITYFSIVGKYATREEADAFRSADPK